MISQNTKKIVCIGGGTGTFVVLRGLKQFHHTLSAIVTMSDSGGSNRRLRDEFGLLPTSDLRQCLVALADESGGVGLLRKLFMYRFEKGNGIAGMTFGNLFMAALTDIVGSQAEAIRKTGKVLRIKGSVIPVTFTDANLYATYENGHTVNEEHLIDEPMHDGKLKITHVSLKPQAEANPDALKVIQQADLIVLGPGDLYTSIIPNLLVSGIADAIKQAKGKIVYVLNLMTKFGQTYNFSASDHIHVLEQFIGTSLKAAVVNSDTFPKDALDAYAKCNEVPVFDDLTQEYFRVIRAPLVNESIHDKSSADTLVRSLIRHDSIALSNVLVSLL